MVELFLIRHAECEANTQHGKVWGRSLQSPLTNIGRIQAAALGRQLTKEGVYFDAVYTSPAERTKDTASIACEELGYPTSKIMVSDWLHQQSHGEWEGKARNDVVQQNSLFRLGHWHFRAPGGESLQDVENRMSEWLNTNVLQQAHMKSVAVFTHHMAIKGLLRNVLRLDPSMVNSMAVDTSAVTHLKYMGGQWNVVKINYAPHLKVLGMKTVY
ncbi:MAG: histidine phosphatase family protein [Candidatus Nanoarchaeia archaeon]